MEPRFLYFIGVRTFLMAFFVFGFRTTTGALLFWSILLGVLMTITSGWFFYYSFRNPKPFGSKGFLSLAVAFIVDMLISKKFFGSSEWLHHIIYATIGTISFFLVYILIKPDSELKIDHENS